MGWLSIMQRSESKRLYSTMIYSTAGYLYVATQGSHYRVFSKRDASPGEKEDQVEQGESQFLEDLIVEPGKL